MHHLVYQSSAIVPMSEDMLEALLTEARTWNTAHNLTGLLLYSDGDILQVLEGDYPDVMYIFDKIKGDLRHHHVTKLADGPIEQRNFSQWSMGFKVLNPTDFGHLAGYLNVSRPDYLPDTYTNDDTSLHGLLASFIQTDTIRF